MGRPRKTLPPRVDGQCVYQALTAWAEDGVSQADAAGRCDLSPATFRKLINASDPRDRRAADSWEVGRGRRESWLWSRLHDKSNRSIAASIYELKSRFGRFDQPKPPPPAASDRERQLVSAAARFFRESGAPLATDPVTLGGLIRAIDVWRSRHRIDVPAQILAARAMSFATEQEVVIEGQLVPEE